MVLDGSIVTLAWPAIQRGLRFSPVAATLIGRKAVPAGPGAARPAKPQAPAASPAPAEAVQAPRPGDRDDASQHTRGRLRGMWQAVLRAFAALGRTHAEQLLMQEAWWQAYRAAVPETGPLAWVLTMDGYRLAGRHPPACSDTSAGGTP